MPQPCWLTDSTVSLVRRLQRYVC